jgi:hypothetical protein
MELKRIIARDTRAANQKAVALYGPDVLVISSSKVRGQTELIVAVDVPPISLEAAVAEAFVPTEKKYALPKESSTDEIVISTTTASFGEVMEETMTRQKRSGQDKTSLPEGFVSAAVLKAKAKTESAPEAATIEVKQAPAPITVDPVAVQAAQEERDSLRGREIVELVREELASLRKEFKLSQQMAWQGAGLSRSLLPLRNALQDAAIPVALRALLIDSIQSFEDVEPAIEEIRCCAAFNAAQQRGCARVRFARVGGSIRCRKVSDGGSFSPTCQRQLGCRASGCHQLQRSACRCLEPNPVVERTVGRGLFSRHQCHHLETVVGRTWPTQVHHH